MGMWEQTIVGPAGGVTWHQDLGLCGRISSLIEINLTSDDFMELLEGEGDPWLLSIVHNEGGLITP